MVRRPSRSCSGRSKLENHATPITDGVGVLGTVAAVNG
jgi:hypothetical protein